MGSPRYSHCRQVPIFCPQMRQEEYVSNGVIIKLLNEMWVWMGDAVDNVIAWLGMVEARHGMVFHSLWHQEKWAKLGGSLGLGSASTPNPLVGPFHMSHGGRRTGKEILSYQVYVQVREPLEESSVDCLKEGCDRRVAEALVCKFNVLGLGGLCVEEASSFNDRIAKGTTHTGRVMVGLFWLCGLLTSRMVTAVPRPLHGILALWHVPHGG
jgi:hypothetical protein